MTDQTIPVERLRPIVQDYLDRGGVREVAGTNARSFYKVIDDPGVDHVTFDFAERLLIAIGRDDAWHADLADLYGDDRGEVAPAAAESPVLADLAGVVEREHAEVTGALVRALEHAMAAGDALLSAQRELVGVTGFGHWVKDRGLNADTAERYMRLAAYREHLEALPEFPELSVNRAQLCLRGMPRRKRPDQGGDELGVEIRRLHSEGVSEVEIAHMVGCSRSGVRYHIDPNYAARSRRSGAGRATKQRAADRDAETARRVEARGGALQEAHGALAQIEDTLGEAIDAATSVDERLDLQRALKSIAEAKHWLARAVRSDLDRNTRPKLRKVEAA